MTISELIVMLEKIKKDHGDISVKRPYMLDGYGDWEYTDIDEAEYKPKKESENSNENTDAYIVLW